MLIFRRVVALVTGKVHDRNTSMSEAEACNILEPADPGRYCKYAIVRFVELEDAFYCFERLASVS